MIRAVLDTNVLLSGLVGFTEPRSTPGQILVRWAYGLFELVTSGPILAELVNPREFLALLDQPPNEPLLPPGT